MKAKSKIKNFFTLNPRAHDGFTLVELIVVIAILAILAGVGTAGYSGYITAANKGNDKVLVGNIIRAVETGHNSYMFQLNEVLQVAADQGVQVPIGFVVLTENGCTTIQSGNSEASSLKGAACEVVTETVYLNPVKTDRSNGAEGCDEKNESAYILTGGEEWTFCKTHSLFTYKRDKVFNDPNAENDISYERKYFYSVSSWTSLLTDHTDGEILTDLPVYGSNSAIQNDVDGNITKSIIAAFGNDLDSIKLTYDGWAMSDLSSFFINATENWGKIKKKAEDATGTMMDILNGLGYGLAQKNDEGQSYDDSADLTNDYARAMATRFENREEFAAMWNAILEHDQPLVEKTFGRGTEAAVGTVGGEDAFYFSGRTMWNQSLAAFVAANSPCPSRTSHASKIEKYGIDLVVAQVPKACTYHSFTTEIRTYDVAGQATYLKPIGCEICQEAAKAYVTSGASTADAYALYDTLCTINATASNGVINGDEYAEIDFFAYYEAYLKEFNALYSTVDEVEGESKIAITFYYRDGKLTYEVSNREADPRNQ